MNRDLNPREVMLKVAAELRFRGRHVRRYDWHAALAEQLERAASGQAAQGESVAWKMAPKVATVEMIAAARRCGAVFGFGAHYEAALRHAPPAPPDGVVDWFVSSQTPPPPGLYVAIYRDGSSLPISLVAYDNYEFLADEDSDICDEDGYVRGFGWHEQIEPEGFDSMIYLRDVIAYMPTNLDGATDAMKKIRESLAAAPAAEPKA